MTSWCPTHASQVMDPLSITASTISIIKVTPDLITTCRKYNKSVKGSTKEITGLIHELESLAIVLKSPRIFPTRRTKNLGSR